MSIKVDIKNSTSTIVSLASAQKVKLPTANKYVNDDIKVELSYDVWNGEKAKHPLCFTANVAGSTISTNLDCTVSGANLQYSTDKNNWTEVVLGTTVITLANIGDKVYFKGDNPNGLMRDSEVIPSLFVMTGSIAASGNIMSLIDNGACTCVVIPSDGCFNKLFTDCTALTSAPELPATTLTSSCYCQMFDGTSIVVAPELPATNLVNYCYYSMFANCTSLTTASSLPALEVGAQSYDAMFSYCSALTTVPLLPATVLQSSCYRFMFKGCTSLIVSDTSGSGYDKPWIIPTNGVGSGIGSSMTYMFQNCSGTRSSDSPNFNGIQKTYYTQNTPV